jgi:hypothetical protein
VSIHSLYGGIQAFAQAKAELLETLRPTLARIATAGGAYRPNEILDFNFTILDDGRVDIEVTTYDSEHNEHNSSRFDADALLSFQTLAAELDRRDAVEEARRAQTIADGQAATSRQEKAYLKILLEKHGPPQD